jgi:hypothetical protein
MTTGSRIIHICHSGLSNLLNHHAPALSAIFGPFVLQLQRIHHRNVVVVAPSPTKEDKTRKTGPVSATEYAQEKF